MINRFSRAVFLQFSGTVGSGIFVLPYLFYRSNFLFATIFLVYLTIITAILNRFYIDIIVNTPGDHQLAGYASYYLGKRFKALTVINLLLLSFGSITAYFRLFVKFFVTTFPVIPEIIPTLLFVFLLAYFSLTKTKRSSTISTIISFSIILVPVVLMFYSLGIAPVSAVTVSPSFLFFGATIFALSGFNIIPEIEELLRHHRKVKQNLYSSSLFGLILSAIAFFLFSFAIITISGHSVSPDSVTGLFSVSPVLGVIVSIFGMAVTFRAATNFMTILRELFFRDLHLDLHLSEILPLFFPILSLALSLVPLVTIISVTGHVTIILSTLIICLIRLKMSPNSFVRFSALLILVSLIVGLVGTFL